MSSAHRPLPARAREIDRLFQRALEVTATERSTWLDRECPDAELRREVEALLAASAGDDSLLEPGGAAQGGLLTDALAPPLAAGSEIDRYRLIGELGRGGMGVVYSAERSDGTFEQQVALKVLGLGTGPEGLTRFGRERQILADLDHPSIARLLDGGVTEQGQPYLVMERVEGKPIDVFCDRQALSVRRRLELFCVVCEAVQAAHRQLVVHRDIKPSNILVTDAGEVKLLDFGIAKLLDEEAAGLTRGPLMTPQYASPEQQRGEPVAVASDVYQLGLLLYELLCGERPYEVSSVTPGEAERLICEEVPRRPSAWVTGRGPSPTAEEVAEKAARRGTRPAVLARELSGDLDTVVAKALAKEAERRYSSVDELRADVERHLGGLPVLARPPEWSYRLGKFLRRNRLPVGLTAATVATVIALTVAFTLRLTREKEQTRLEADRAVAERIRAEQHRDESEEVLAFLLDLFEASDPYDAPDPAITARDLLDRAAVRIDDDLLDRPTTRARMLTTIGRLYGRLGLWDRSDELVRQSVEVLERSAVKDGLVLAESLHELGDAHYRRDEFQEATVVLERALELWEADPATPPSWIATTAGSLGSVHHHRGNFEAAEELRQRAVTIFRQAPNGQIELAVALTNLAHTTISQGERRKAEGILTEALELWEAAGLPDDPRYAGSLGTLGRLYASFREPERALPLFERSYQVSQRLLEPGHPSLASALSNLGAVYNELGRNEEAEHHLRLALTYLEQAGRADSTVASMILNNLANILTETSRAAEAETLLRQALAIQEQHYGPQAPRVALANHNLGETLLTLGRRNEAAAAFEHARGLFGATVGEDHLYVSWPLYYLGRMHLEDGELDGAEELLRAAVEIRRRELPAGSDDVRKAEQLLAEALRRQGRDREAADVVRPPSG